MRRRAARFGEQGDAEHAAYELERAALFEARADAKRAGRLMPRPLRTPAESLARIDELRRALGALLDAFDDLEADEWEAFRDALSARGFVPARPVGCGSTYVLTVDWR